MSDDLSALAWVYEEVRKSLDTAHKALQRCLKEAVATGFSDVDALDPAILRSARQQIHQGVGALELAGLPAGAMLLRASEAAVQRFVARPQALNERAVKTIEAASFALLDLMRRRLAGKPVSAVALFPQYEALAALSGQELVRPSDLWAQEWPALSLDTPVAPPEDIPPREADEQAVGAFETALLQLLRGGQPAQARSLVTLCAGLAAGASARQAHRESATWTLACGFLEAIAQERLPLSVHVKRVLSGLLSQLRTLARSPGLPSDRLAQELLFFCAQAGAGGEPRPAEAGAVLDQLRRAFRLDAHRPVDLTRSALGRFDPAWVTQAGKRVTAAKEGWSAVAAGELLRLTGLNEQFALVADSVQRLYPDGQGLAGALTDAAAATVQAGAAPAAPLAMEVATSLLYLEASLDEAEFEQPEERQRVQRLAERIQAVRSGQPPQPLEPWMEALYRQVSDRQTIGSVVQELRASLGECEKRIDQFFRDHQSTTPLVEVPSQLQSMKGVLAVLGLDAASQAMARMRADVEGLLAPGADFEQAAQSGVHDRLASNLGAVGFLVDMLAVQPALAKNLFVFHDDTGVLAPIMGRAAVPSTAEIDPVESIARPAEQVERARALEAAETLKESLTREDLPLLEVSDELQQLAESPLVQEQPELAASLATAQEALDRAVSSSDAEQAQQARDDIVLALTDFAEVVSTPMGLDLLDAPAPEPEPTTVPTPLLPQQPAVPEATGLEEDDEMRDIFIEEAREVLADAQAAVQGLRDQPDDVGLLTTVRRAFHTLKGSSRMVGLGDFGEAAWACEQLYNSWLASQAPASGDLQAFTAEALDHLAQWVDAIVARQAQGWTPQGLVRAADAMRLEQRRVPIGADAPVVGGEAHEASGVDDVADVADVDVDVDVDVLALPDVQEMSVADSGDGDPFAEETVPAPALHDDAHAAQEATPPLVEATPPARDETVPSAALSLSDASLPAEGDDAVDRIVLDLSADEPLLLPAVDEDHATAAEEAAPPADEADAPSAAAVAATAAAAMMASLPDLDLSLPVKDEPATTPAALDAADLDLVVGSAEAAQEETFPAQDGPTEADLPDTLSGVALSEAPGMEDADAAQATLADPASAPEAQGTPVTEIGTGGDVDGGPEDDQVKVIGHLRIGIPLFNIYLNEADEQSRRLSVMLSEWALEWHRPVAEEAVALAHSLAGNSGTVGYVELSQLARLLEHSLAKSRALGLGDAATAELFSEAADEIRRLLHQFAAGFLKLPQPELISRLERFELQEPVRADARQHLRLVHPALSAEDPPGDASVAADAAPARPLEERAAVDEHAATPQPAGDEDGVSLPMPLGLPEVRPFEPMADLPSLSVGGHAGQEVDLGQDADIDAVDAIDPDLFPIFEEEALELLPLLAADMRQWTHQPAQRDMGVACMRTLHTFKGGARLAGAMRLGELAHRMETGIERLLAADTIVRDDLEPLQARSDLLVEVFESLQRRDVRAQQALAEQGAPEATAVPDAVVAAEVPASHAGQAFEGLPAEGGSPTDQASATTAGEPDAALGGAEAPALAVAPIDWSQVRHDFVPGIAAATAGDTGAGMAAVRVKPRLLDRLVNHAGEVSIARTRLSSQMQQMRSSVGDLTDNLERLRQQLRDIELQAETQLSTRMEAARAAQQQFDPLEFDRYTRFQELTRMMAESVNDVATVQRGLVRNLEAAEDQLAAQSRLTRDLQDDLLRTRMVEFDGLTDRLYRVVRQAAKETGKQVRLDIAGGHTEVDRGVLERMTGAFEHLLRNSVTHGIEPPADRQAAGKDAVGSIIVAVRQEGNEVSIEFRDDGAGLNLDRIRRKAQALKLLPEGAEPSEAELAQMIFTPGFSTADTVTELAGRGIGMDVVRADVNAMGGRIETATAAGRGTSFKLVLPLTTAVTKVVMVRCGDLVISIPTNLVELVRRARAEEIEQAYGSGAFAYGDLSLPFFWFGALLQHSPRGTAEGRSLPVIVVRSAQQRVALHVDEVLGNQDVVVKNLGPQLSRVPGLAGMTLLASGAVALIYNPVALAAIYGSEAQAWARQAAMAPSAAVQDPVRPALMPEARQAPLVLVVDDSLTVRRVTQRLLTREGYRVTLAKDGLEALEKMAEELPVVVLSDIEMPRMDGFDLVRNLRGDERWRQVPVIMITSRIAQKHKDYAAELGVDHYLGKPYSEDELVSLVAQYTRAAAAQETGHGEPQAR